MQLHPTDSAPQVASRNIASEMAAVIPHHAAAYEGHRAVVRYTHTRRRRRSSKTIEGLILSLGIALSSTELGVPWMGGEKLEITVEPVFQPHG